jgi:hypothetical protein
MKLLSSRQVLPRLPLLRPFSTVPPPKRPRNPNLKQVISQGMPYLEACTKDVLQNARESLFDASPGPSPNQLSEASRILDVVTSVVDDIAEKSGEFCIQGYPIMILDAEVSPDCKQARIFWCIPLHYSDLPEASSTKITTKMQELLDKRGSRIQSHVFGRLRHYYPPKLRFVPVPVKVAIEDFLRYD